MNLNITYVKSFHCILKDLSVFQLNQTLSFYLYLLCCNVRDLKTRDSLEVKCREHFLKLENEISSIIDDISIRKFDDMINNSLKPNVSDGVMQATNMAAGTVAKLGI